MGEGIFQVEKEFVNFYFLQFLFFAKDSEERRKKQDFYYLVRKIFLLTGDLFLMQMAWFAVLSFISKFIIHYSLFIIHYSIFDIRYSIF